MNKGDQYLFSLIKPGKLLSFFGLLQEQLFTVYFSLFSVGSEAGQQMAG
jgi:hypothetical protein